MFCNMKMLKTFKDALKHLPKYGQFPLDSIPTWEENGKGMHMCTQVEVCTLAPGGKLYSLNKAEMKRNERKQTDLERKVWLCRPREETCAISQTYWETNAFE